MYLFLLLSCTCVKDPVLDEGFGEGESEMVAPSAQDYHFTCLGCELDIYANDFAEHFRTVHGIQQDQLNTWLAFDDVVKFQRSRKKPRVMGNKFQLCYERAYEQATRHEEVRSLECNVFRMNMRYDPFAPDL